MKELLQQFAQYNAWANKRFIDLITGLSPEQQKQEVSSSFNSLYATLLHMWDAEEIWWQRLKLREQIIIPSISFNPVMQEVAEGLTSQDNEWVNWVNNASERQLEHVFEYRNSKKELFKQPVAEVLFHLFNHGTFHRGQLVTILRNTGVEKIPSTDFIQWCRRGK
ncbi:MAG: hypothetical protein JWN76_3415 [Chitinophagaceae bacterium]|nr:hypothetical protein [Chitinophagaceae bacterium]